MIKERLFCEDIMLGPIKLYDKTKQNAHNAKFLTENHENDNGIIIFMEIHHNQLVLMIHGNMIS